MIYLFKVTGKDINIRHTTVTHDARVHVAVLDDSFDENVLLSLVLPEFTITSNKLDQYDCYIYLNFIIDRYESILRNLKSEKDINKFFKRGSDLMYEQDLNSTEEYIEYIKYKANKVIKSYSSIGLSPFQRLMNLIKRKERKLSVKRSDQYNNNNKGLPL